MTTLGIGDLARSYVLKGQNFELKAQATRLATELATGQTSDVAGRLSGDFIYLSEIERNISTLASYRTAITEAQTTASAIQTVLDTVHTKAGNLANTLIANGNNPRPNAISFASKEAAETLGHLTAALNTTHAGRSLFSGAASDQRALASGGDMLAAIIPALAGAGDANTVVAALDAWFDTPGGGFETLGYLGGATAISAIPIGEGEAIALDLRADHTALRDVLKAVTLAAVADDPALGLSQSDRVSLQSKSIETLLTAQTGVTDIQGTLGFAEARLEERAVQNSAQRSGLDYAKNALLGVDPYETATRLEAVQFQLESLYTVTARMSRLSLMDYL